MSESSRTRPANVICKLESKYAHQLTPKEEHDNDLKTQRLRQNQGSTRQGKPREQKARPARRFGKSSAKQVECADKPRS